MRINEYVLSKDDSVVSKTDLFGNITYINQDFIRISGYSEKELMGSSHNIVRHPDMPKEAFKDLWLTLKTKKSWSGLVKNLCKNGDFYWVLAHVSPIFDNNVLVGYMSVRCAPDYKSVIDTEIIYRKIKNGESKYIIKEGTLIRRSLINTNCKKLLTGIVAQVILSGSILIFNYYYDMETFSKSTTVQNTQQEALTILNTTKGLVDMDIIKAKSSDQKSLLMKSRIAVF